jgi:hypothetical protein
VERVVDLQITMMRADLLHLWVENFQYTPPIDLGKFRFSRVMDVINLIWPAAKRSLVTGSIACPGVVAPRVPCPVNRAASIDCVTAGVTSFADTLGYRWSARIGPRMLGTSMAPTASLRVLGGLREMPPSGRSPRQHLRTGTPCPVAYGHAAKLSDANDRFCRKPGPDDACQLGSWGVVELSIICPVSSETRRKVSTCLLPHHAAQRALKGP